MKKIKLSDLTPDSKNANKHSEFGMGLLENSVRFNGFGRSGVLSADNVIIAGNGMTEAAGSIGTEEAIIIESDGTKPVYVKRTDIKSGTAEFYNMALADNIVASKNIVMDAETVEALAEEMPETKFWADLVLAEPKKSSSSNGREDLVEIKLTFSSRQHADFKRAIKLGKQKFNIENPESDSEQSNILHSILKEFIKSEK